jgi:hypothetical protein
MPVNYVLLGEITTNVSTTSVTFSNIPQTGYTDLKIVWSARGTDNTSYNYITFNSAVGSGRVLYAETSGPTVASFTQTVIQPISSQTYPSVTTNTFANSEMYIPNYSVAGIAKNVSITGVTSNNSSSGVLGIQDYITSTTSAITTITIQEGGSTDTGTFLAGSSFSLYGIAAFGTTPTILPKATGGDIITNDGTYWYHAFLSSGTFTPLSALTCSALVVAGGGGGGDWASGGGGAGGVSYISALAINASTSTTVTIGAGGAQNVAGSNSVLGSIISNGGGRGGTNNTPIAGGTGGSGGGGAINGAGGSANQGNTGGATGYGNNGGTSTSSAEPYSSAGGGGAGGVGGSVSTSPGGAGGVGITNSTINTLNAFGAATGTGQLSSGNYYYAGGGGGASSSGNGAGGLGGGGAGINNSGAAATAGTINTGGGGGGNRQATGGGGAGGSGIVIVRYTMA